MSLDRYKSLLKSSFKFNEPTISAHIPKPNDSDYERGFITRYFIQKINDKSSPIMEVDSKTFSRLVGNVFYSTTSIRWKISGVTETVYNSSGDIKYKSVSESNRLSVKFVEKDMPNLKLYLPNLLQFYKE